MVYCDTNLLVYASVEQDIAKKEVSLKRLEALIGSGKLMLSTLVLQEFVFTLAKLGIDNEVIRRDSEFYMGFVAVEQDVFTLKRAIDLCCQENFCKNINDVVHLLLAEKAKCKSIVTFDGDFKRLEGLGDVVIEVL